MWSSLLCKMFYNVSFCPFTCLMFFRCNKNFLFQIMKKRVRDSSYLFCDTLTCFKMQVNTTLTLCNIKHKYLMHYRHQLSLSHDIWVCNAVLQPKSCYFARRQLDLKGHTDIKLNHLLNCLSQIFSRDSKDLLLGKLYCQINTLGHTHSTLHDYAQAFLFSLLVNCR